MTLKKNNSKKFYRICGRVLSRLCYFKNGNGNENITKNILKNLKIFLWKK